MGNLLLILGPAAIIVLLTVSYLNRAVSREASPAGGPSAGPMWTTPVGFGILALLALSAIAILAPRLLGLTFFVLPFLWSRGPGRRQGGGPDRPRRMDDE